MRSRIQPYLLKVATCFVVMLLVSPSQAADKPDTVQTLLVRGGRALKVRNYDRARAAYHAVLKIDSTNVEA
ncbi:MAG: hypothetical protein D6800_08605, partial [Candidatus Zixiibacteriota bacterium]